MYTKRSNTMKHEQLIGKRIVLIEMGKDEKFPVEGGTKGTITHYGYGVYSVDWDNGRTLGVVEGVDRFEVLTDTVGNTNLGGNEPLYFTGNY